MEKPITVAYEEFKQNVADLVNNSGLPAFVIEWVLQSYSNEVHSIAETQYETDKEQYESTNDNENSNEE